MLMSLGSNRPLLWLVDYGIPTTQGKGIDGTRMEKNIHQHICFLWTKLLVQLDFLIVWLPIQFKTFQKRFSVGNKANKAPLYTKYPQVVNIQVRKQDKYKYYWINLELYGDSSQSASQPCSRTKIIPCSYIGYNNSNVIFLSLSLSLSPCFCIYVFLSIYLSIFYT